MKTVRRKAKVYKNGNSLAISFGVKNPLQLREGDMIDLEITSTKGYFTKLNAPRAGWDEQFKQALIDEPEIVVNDAFGVLHSDAAISDGLEDYKDDDWSHLGED